MFANSGFAVYICTYLLLQVTRCGLHSLWAQYAGKLYETMLCLKMFRCSRDCVIGGCTGSSSHSRVGCIAATQILVYRCL